MTVPLVHSAGGTTDGLIGASGHGNRKAQESRGRMLASLSGQMDDNYFIGQNFACEIMISQKLS